MPNKTSAAKRMRQNAKRAERNKAAKNAMKTVIKSVSKAVEANDASGVKDSLKKAVKTISKTAQKGVIHKRNAARKQSRLTKKVNAFLAQSQQASQEKK